MIEIRKANAGDSDQIWEIIREVISKGDTYTFDPNSSKEMMLNYWYGPDRHTYVATDKGKIVGTFLIRDNQPGLGAHIANGSYMVSEAAVRQRYWQKDGGIFISRGQTPWVHGHAIQYCNQEQYKGSASLAEPRV